MEMRAAGSARPPRPACPLPAALACTVGLLTACGKEPATATYLQNPDAQDAYTVTLTLHDAPPDLVASSAYVQYRIADTACMPPVTTFSGVRPQRTVHSLDVPLQRIDATTYIGTWFRDGLLEKDYYGRGICRWKIELVGASMHTEKTRSFTYFSISVLPKEGRSTRFAEKSIQPRFDDGERHLARDWSEQMFFEEVAADKRAGFFSFSLSAEQRGARP